MAIPDVTKPDMGLFTDFEATRVELPHLVEQNRRRSYDQATVLFEGDEQETVFRGLGRARSYPLRSRYTYREHAEYLSLIELFEAAHDAGDGRLMLRTNSRLVAGLDLLEVVTVAEVEEEHLGGQAWDVVFTAVCVDYTLEA